MKKEIGGFEKFNRVPKSVNTTISIIFILLSILCIIPVILVFMVSISSERSIQDFGYRFWPNEFSLKAYSFLYESKNSILRSFLVSIIVTVLGTFVGLFLNTTLGYALSRNTFKLKKLFTWIIFIPMLFSGGMIASYIVVSNMLNLKDTIWALILPSAVSSFNIIILRTFFQTTIPDSLIESAKLDGASQLRIFITIVLPISLPAIATIGLFLTFAYWNDWYNALLYIDDSRLVPIQALLNKIQGEVEFLNQNISLLGVSASELLDKVPKETVRMAIVIVVVLPIACSYPFFQKYFISGLTIGAVKE